MQRVEGSVPFDPFFFFEHGIHRMVSMENCCFGAKSEQIGGCFQARVQIRD
jgi:hypothetical protein